jgi:hypothetical protein
LWWFNAPDKISPCLDFQAALLICRPRTTTGGRRLNFPAKSNVPSFMNPTIEKALANSQTYPDFRTTLAGLLAQGKTTGNNHSESYIAYTELNQSRMNRLDRKTRFLPEMSTLLERLKQDYIMLVITEGWCGDAAQLVPMFHHMAVASPRLSLRLVLRDEHPELMDQFLTNGGRSIPKLILLDAKTHAVLADWGPRPFIPQKMVMEYTQQAAPKPDFATFQQEIHAWYARNKTVDAQLEMIKLFQTLNAELVD